MKKRKFSINKFADILKSFDRCLNVIHSCRTFEHIEVAKKMIDNFFILFPESKTNSLRLYLKKRMSAIAKYKNTLEGTTVMVITNEDEPIEKGIVTRFNDFDKVSQDYLPMVKFERDEKEYLCMGVLLPFNEKLREELMQINCKERWKKAAEINKEERSNLYLQYTNSPLYM